MSSKRTFDIPDPFAVEGADESPLPPPPALMASPDRGIVRRRRIVALAVAVAFECALICSMGVRPMSGKVVALGVVSPLLLAAVALALLLRPQTTTTRLAVGAAAASLLFFIGTALEAHASSAPAAAAVTCMTVTSLLLAGPLLVGAWALRNAFPSGAPGRAAALGVAAGLLGAATIRLHCPHDDSLHVMLGHGIPVLAACLLARGAYKIVRA